MNQRKEYEQFREAILADVKDMSTEEQYGVLGDQHPDFMYTL